MRIGQVFCYVFLPLILISCNLNLAKVREPFHTEISGYFTDTQLRRVNTVQNESLLVDTPVVDYPCQGKFRQATWPKK